MISTTIHTDRGRARAGRDRGRLHVPASYSVVRTGTEVTNAESKMPTSNVKSLAADEILHSFSEEESLNLSRAEKAVVTDRTVREGGVRRDPCTLVGSPSCSWHEDERLAGSWHEDERSTPSTSPKLPEVETRFETPPLAPAPAAEAVSAVPASTAAATGRDATSVTTCTEERVGASSASKSAATIAAMVQVPAAPAGESGQVLHRLAALTSAAQLRSVCEDSSDSDLMKIIRAVRELHATWLQTDASLINTSIQLTLLQRDTVEQEEAFSEDRKVLTQERATCASKLADANARIAELEAEARALKQALAARTNECDGLTIALQQAILEQKGVAESQQKWRR